MQSSPNSDPKERAKLLKVYLVMSTYQLVQLFLRKPEFIMTERIEDADIVVWPGGADVDPSFYEHPKHKTTNTYSERDKLDVRAWNLVAPKVDVIKIGICRGAQFLNVMNGGTMYQDVNNHTSTHKMWCAFTEKEITVSSTHHQMMLPGADAYVIGTAEKSTYKVDYDEKTKKFVERTRLNDEPKSWENYGGPDPEVIWYDDTNTLCYQPHPEYDYPADLADHFHTILLTIIKGGMTE